MWLLTRDKAIAGYAVLEPTGRTFYLMVTPTTCVLRWNKATGHNHTWLHRVMKRCDGRWNWRKNWVSTACAFIRRLKIGTLSTWVIVWGCWSRAIWLIP